MDSGDKLESYREFISTYTPFIAEELFPCLENRFKRITLVNKEKTERITIDTSLEFHNFVTGEKMEMPRLVIIELKRDAQANTSMLPKLLRELLIHESGFSKYCIGMAITNPFLRCNRIKPRLRLVNKLIS